MTKVEHKQSSLRTLEGKNKTQAGINTIFNCQGIKQN